MPLLPFVGSKGISHRVLKIALVAFMQWYTRGAVLFPLMFVSVCLIAESTRAPTVITRHGMHFLVFRH